MNRYQRNLERQMDRVLELEAKGALRRKGGNRALRRMLNNRLAVLGLAVFAAFLIFCFGAPLFTSYAPTRMNISQTMRPPSWEHLLGTDKIGRDIFSRVLYGGRISILVGLGSALGSALAGVSLGVFCGYRGGWADRIVFRASELFMAFPQMILTLLLVSIVGQNLGNLFLIFIATGWGSMYRMTRSMVLSQREMEYVQALRAFGLNELVIGFKHILPNVVGPVAVNITLSTAMFILQEASLSLLGLGVPMEIPTWGNILNAANDFTVLKNNWWIWLPVGTVISLFVLSINFIGDGLRDAADPSQRG